MERRHVVTTRPGGAASGGARERSPADGGIIRPRAVRVVLAASASALLGTLSFPPYSAVPLVFVAWVPTLAVAVGDSRRQAFVVGWLAATLGHLGACPWVLPTIARFEETSRAAAAPFFGLFMAYYGLQGGLFTLGAAWFTTAATASRAQELAGTTGPQDRRVPPAHLGVLAVVIASWWVLLEWGFPKPIPWSFGDTLAASAVLRQGADLGGVYGLTFLIVLVNAALTLALTQRSTRVGDRLLPVGAAGVLLLGATTYGTVRLHTLGGPVADRPGTTAMQAQRSGRTLPAATPNPGRAGGHADEIDMLIVQGGLESGRHDLSAANEAAWATYGRLTAEAIAPAGPHDAVAPATVGTELLRTVAVRSGDLTADAPRGTAVGDTPSDEPRPAPDLIVWPETVLRVYLRDDGSYRGRVVDFVRRLGRPLLTGALDRPAAGPGEFNSGYLITPEPDAPRLTTKAPTGASNLDPRSPGNPAGALQIYHKLTLLPFGEYVPGAAWLPVLARWQTTGRFLSGASADGRGGSVTLGLKTSSRQSDEAGLGVQFAPSICFEALWPGAFNAAVRQGAAFLINLTDDGWFGASAGPYQHLYAATLRAVETRRWLVRASNSGVSAVVDPTGRIVAALPLDAVGVLRHRVGLTDAVPLYVRLGDWPVAASALATVAFVLTVWRRRALAPRHAPRRAPRVTTPAAAAFAAAPAVLNRASGHAQREAAAS